MWKANAILSRTAVTNRDNAAEILAQLILQRALSLNLNSGVFLCWQYLKEGISNTGRRTENKHYSSRLKPYTTMVEEGSLHLSKYATF